LDEQLNDETSKIWNQSCQGQSALFETEIYSNYDDSC
jgi:hypothetical protein